MASDMEKIRQAHEWLLDSHTAEQFEAAWEYVCYTRLNADDFRVRAECARLQSSVFGEEVAV